MKRIQGALAAAALALGCGIAAAGPASAADADPHVAAELDAVVSCSFAELHNNSDLSDLQQYVTRGTELDVTGGSYEAWKVDVLINGKPSGWMSGDCVSFLE